MAKYLLLRSWLVFLKTSARCGLPIFLKVNHRLESRMQEICQSGSEGGAKRTFVPTPISAQGLPGVYPGLAKKNVPSPEGGFRDGNAGPIGSRFLPYLTAPSGPILVGGINPGYWSSHPGETVIAHC